MERRNKGRKGGREEERKDIEGIKDDSSGSGLGSWVNRRPLLPAFPAGPTTAHFLSGLKVFPVAI